MQLVDFLPSYLQVDDFRCPVISYNYMAMCTALPDPNPLTSGIALLTTLQIPASWCTFSHVLSLI